MNRSAASLRALHSRFFLALLCGALLSLGVGRANAATFTVTNRNDSGTGSLRAAITSANGTAAADTINFAIAGEGPHLIALASVLPTITQPLTIDGYSQSGALPNTLEDASNAVIMVQLDALPSVGALGVGLAVCSSNVSIRGLSITGFAQRNLTLGADNALENCPSLISNLVVAGNFLGLTPDGRLPTANTFRPLIVTRAVANIGGDLVADRNVIASGLAAIAGVTINDNTAGTAVDGNLIGTDPSGRFDRGAGSGVLMASSATDVHIGLVRPNLIAFNSEGIRLLAAAGTANSIARNRFVGNQQAIDLGGDGITANDLNDVDTGPNDLQNFPLLTSPTRTATSLVVQGTLDRPAGAAPRAYSITVYASTACSADGHGPGERILGSRDIVLINGSSESFGFTLSDIGPLALGTVITATATNSANTSEMSACVSVTEGAGAQIVTNTNDSGAGSLRNAITQANANVDPSVIAFNIPGTGPHTIQVGSNLPTITAPVLIDGYSQPGATENTFAGDASNAVIRIRLDGAPGIGNIGSGLSVCSSDVSIRGLSITNFAQAAIIFGTNNSGGGCGPVNINGIVAGNFLGLHPDGILQSTASFNQLLVITSTVRVGGVEPADRNVVAAGNTAAVSFSQGSNGSTVDGNLFGTDPSGLQDRGSGAGVKFTLSASNLRIGQERSNLMAFNTHGLFAINVSGSGNSFGRNAFVANSQLGVDLNDDGVTANDLNDADSGPNNLQNFPQLFLAQQISGGGVRVLGRLDVPIPTAAGRYTITLYESAACDASGFGEGSILLGSQDVLLTHLTVPPAVSENFVLKLPAAPAIGAVLTATATAPDGSTSEFSRCITVVSSEQLLRDSFEGTP